MKFNLYFNESNLFDIFGKGARATKGGNVDGHMLST